MELPLQAVVLATGDDSRFGALTANRPLALVRIAGRPTLARVLDAVLAAPVTDAVVVAGGHAETIRGFVAAEYGGRPVRVVEALDRRLLDKLSGDVLLLDADRVFDPELVQGLVSERRTAFAVEHDALDRIAPDPAALAVELDGDTIRGLVRGTSGVATHTTARALGVYLLRGAAARSWLAAALRIETVARSTEVVLDELLRAGGLQAAPHRVAARVRWTEIRGPDDLDTAELRFADATPTLRDKRVFLFDRDGTLSLGDKPIPGVGAVLQRLRDRGARCLVMTNNSSRTPAEHAARLTALDLGFVAQDVCVSTDAALSYLREHGLERVHWLATQTVGAYMTAAGVRYDETSPQALLLTYDTELTYEKLRRFALALQRGTPFFATHPDLVCPSPEGPLPDVGSFLDMLETATGRRPDRVFGKPDPGIVAAALARLGAGFGDAVVVGDRLYTDIAMAEPNALTSVLVLTGETTRADYEASSTRADIVVSELTRLLEHL